MRVGAFITPIDLLISIGVFVVFLFYLQQPPNHTLVLALGALNALMLVVRRRFPVATLAGCLGLSGFIAVLVRRTYPATPADLVALYSVGRYCGRTVAVIAAIVTLAIGITAATWSRSIPSYDLRNISSLGWVVVAVVAGAWVRIQRTYVTGAEERAVRAERDREEEASHRATEERIRIARELHDIVGHALMSISVTSSVNARLADRDPASAQEALQSINQVANSALREVRTTLNLLRGGAKPLKTPQRGLDDLQELVVQARRSGLPVTLFERGRRPEVPAIVGFTVYRIVQESLTNVARHGQEVTRVTVSITFTPQYLDLAITNDGRHVPAPVRTGLGLQGMRERAAATGGRLQTTALPGGGFRVQARLPLKERTK